MQNKKSVYRVFNTLPIYSDIDTFNSELQKLVTEAKADGWTNLKVDAHSIDGDPIITLSGNRQETDFEFNHRIERESRKRSLSTVNVFSP